MPAEIRLAVFFLELPEAVAIENGSTFTFRTEDSFAELEGVDAIHPMVDAPPIPLSGKSGGNVFVSFRILQVDASQLTERPPLEATDRAIERVLPDSVAPRNRSRADAPRLYPYRTVIEAVTPVRASDENELTIAFDRCERYLWKLIDAYRIVAPRMIGRVTRELLPPIVPFITRDMGLIEGWDDGLSLFHVNWNVPQGEPLLGPESIEKFRIILSHTMVEHPFAAYSLRSKEAASALSQRGDTVDAVVKAQLAAEVLLDAVLVSMLWEEGADPEQCASDIFQDGLSKRVRTYYGSRLGGNWNTDGKGAIAEWSRKLTALRGRVVHGDYRPSRDEARSALDALQGVDAFIRERLASNKNKYKRTTLMLLGRPGLERLQAWSGKIVRFVEEEAGNEPDWRLSLKGWREQLGAAR